MRLLIVLTLSALAGAAAEIPKTAVQTTPGVYRYTDPQGKKWIYSTTPFGVARSEDKPAAAQPAVDGITAIEAGEFIRFERPGPFGIYKWQTRKADLTENERSAWERSRSKKD